MGGLALSWRLQRDIIYDLLLHQQKYISHTKLQPVSRKVSCKEPRWILNALRPTILRTRLISHQWRALALPFSLKVAPYPDLQLVQRFDAPDPETRVA